MQQAMVNLFADTGWQQANFTTPIQIQPNTTYVVSYHTSVGRYSVSSRYFQTPGSPTAR